MDKLKRKTGPKPKDKALIKQQVNLYIETWKIEQLGGKDACRVIGSEAIEKKVAKKVL